MGLMSIVNSLASSPIGKVAGGFLEGEIDERKEAARLQEEKDKRYANITDGLVNNLLTIEANVIANATRESNIYDEAKNWAIGKFGDGGLAVVERMRQDGLFSGAQDLNSVLTNSNNMYGAGLPEGSEPWYQQPEWQEFSTAYKDYTAPTNTYQNRKTDLIFHLYFKIQMRKNIQVLSKVQVICLVNIILYCYQIH